MFYEAEPSIEILQGTELELNKILLNHFDKLRIKPRGERGREMNLIQGQVTAAIRSVPGSSH